MIGNRLFGVVTKQPKKCQLNGIAVVNKLQITIKDNSVRLARNIKYMHKTHYYYYIATTIITIIIPPIENV